MNSPKFCVYRFLNKDNEILYVGKTVDLKQRLSGHNVLSKYYYEIDKIEYIEFKTDADIDIVERYFIRKYHPKYNKALNDGTVSFNITEFDETLRKSYKKTPTNAEIALQELKQKENKLLKLKTKKINNKRVIHSDLGIIYKNLKEVSQTYNISLTLLYNHCECNHKRIKYNDYSEYVYLDSWNKEFETSNAFMYYEDYFNSPNRKYIDESIKDTTTKVICLTTGEIFNNRRVAETHYKVNGIRTLLEKGGYYRGSHNGKPLIWMNYEEYKKISNEDIEKRIQRAYEIFNKRNK